MPSWCACAAEVSVDRQTGVVTVQKLWLILDAGIIIDPDGARAQVEGAMLWGLSMALNEGTDFVNGRVRDTNLDTYTPLRDSDVPEFDISSIDSTEVQVGMGEPPTTIIAPAIGEFHTRSNNGASSSPPPHTRGRSASGVGVAASCHERLCRRRRRPPDELRQWR
nr:molybdopterin cofactor-binding domain-containing protein [uncultured Lichenicoccus sp.]